MEVKWYVAIIIGVVALLVGLIVGFLVSRKLFQRELEKNPPVTSDVFPVDAWGNERYHKEW